jgi:hypothetical protein
LPDKAGGHSRNNSSGRHILRYYCAGTNHRLLADCDAAQDDRAAANRGASPNDGRHDLPVGFGLQPTIGTGTGLLVVDENHSVSDEHLILNRNAFAYESVGRNLAARADDSVLLDFNEGADLGIVTDCAAIEVYEVRLENPHAVTKHNIRTYRRA